MPFYTYVHTRNDDGSVFYVGKGTALLNRAFALNNHNRHWNNIVAKHGHEVVVIEHFNDEQDAFALERYLISSFRALGINICNLTDGGEGCSGLVHSAETRARFSAVRRGVKQSAERSAKSALSRTGLVRGPLSEEAKARISRGRSGITPVFKHPEERLVKIAAANRGRVVSEETRKKISLASVGRTHSDESKRRMSIANAGRVVSDETKARMSEANKGKKLSPEHIEKLAASKRGKRLSLGHRAKLSAAHKGHSCSAETRAKISNTKRSKHG